MTWASCRSRRFDLMAAWRPNELPGSTAGPRPAKVGVMPADRPLRVEGLAPWRIATLYFFADTGRVAGIMLDSSESKLMRMFSGLLVKRGSF